MSARDLHGLLDDLRRLPHETEWVEFKEAKTGLNFDDVGKYFSALSNEANLKGKDCGWLVFGVRDVDRAIVGTKYRENPADLDSLKHEVARHTTGGLTFLDIHVLNHADGRVVLFEIPPAMPGIPVAWKGPWYGRNGESLVTLTLDEIDAIRSQSRIDDWSAGLCPNTTLDDLDPIAVETAKIGFIAKNRGKFFTQEASAWSDAELLDRARLTKDGQITRTALLLLGREESAHHLEPAVAQITWRLEGEEQAYEHLSPPFLLSVNQLYLRIRNINQKLEVPRQLVPFEVSKYEKWVIMEALHNAIAHQDYSMQGRIVVQETNDRLVFISNGRFFEGEPSDYVLGTHTPHRYRNKFLADAMVSLNMIDSMGFGIRRMFDGQRKRFYPLPDYDLSDPDKVIVTIHGRVIDPNYTALLMDRQDLPLETVILLDRVQKQLRIEKVEARKLRRAGLIEGRYPNVFVAAGIASATGNRAQYIRNRAFDDEHYRRMVLQYLEKYDSATRQDIDSLLTDKLSDVLRPEQKRNKIRNLLRAMAMADLIRNRGSKRYPEWVVVLDKKLDG